MGKSKAKIGEVAKSYVADLLRLFPDVEAEIILEKPPGGFDVWVRAECPPEPEELRDRVSHAAAGLEGEYWDRTGVSIETTALRKEAVPNG